MRNIGSYGVIRLIGKGGMSEVYEVENVRLGSRHALKLFTYEKDDSEVRARFLAEGKLLARLNHPRIVRVTDFGTDEATGRPYFVMDLVLDGSGRPRSLAEVEPGTADEEEIGRWYDDLREGLAYIHANGVIHRDLKLQNVLIGPDGHAVLTDFGISKVVVPEGDGQPIVDTVNTIVKLREGRSLVMGSVGYMAPELEMGVAASPQSDWYALGVIVYRLLTGSWCDARTDVVGTLETYDPVWTQILPKLLHANPQGRECLPFADARRRERERAEFELEERWLKAKSRTWRMRRVALALGGALVVACGIGLWLFARSVTLQMRLDLPVFAEICQLPTNAPASGATGYFQSSRGQGALVDAWVLTHAIFDDLRRGNITTEKAVSSLRKLADKSDLELMSLFNPGTGVMAHGDFRLLSRILKTAAQNMENHEKSK